MPSKTPITPIRLPPKFKKQVQKSLTEVPGLTLNSLITQLLELHMKYRTRRTTLIDSQSLTHLCSFKHGLLPAKPKDPD